MPRANLSKFGFFSASTCGDPYYGRKIIAESGFLTRSISKPYDRATAMPKAWELINQVRLKRVRVVIVERVKLCDSRSGIGWRGDRSFNGAIFRFLVFSHGLNRFCHKSAKKSPFSESAPISKRKQPINLKKLPFPDYVKVLWTLFFTF